MSFSYIIIIQHVYIVGDPQHPQLEDFGGQECVNVLEAHVQPVQIRGGFANSCMLFAYAIIIITIIIPITIINIIIISTIIIIAIIFIIISILVQDSKYISTDCDGYVAEGDYCGDLIWCDNCLMMGVQANEAPEDCSLVSFSFSFSFSLSCS